MRSTAFRLPNGQTASCEWGSHAIRLAAPLVMHKDTVYAMLAALLSGQAPRATTWRFGWPWSCTKPRTACRTCAPVSDCRTSLHAQHTREILGELRLASYDTPLGRKPVAKHSVAYRRWRDQACVLAGSAESS